MRPFRASACALALLLILPAVAGAASAQSLLGSGLSDALLVSALRDRDAERLLLVERFGGIDDVRAELDDLRDDRRDAQRELVQLRRDCDDRLDDARADLRRADTRSERRDARDDLRDVRDACLDAQDDLRDEIRALDRRERRVDRAFGDIDLDDARDLGDARNVLRDRARIETRQAELEARCDARESIVGSLLDVAPLAGGARDDLRDERRDLREDCREARRELRDDLRDVRDEARDVRRGSLFGLDIFRFRPLF